MSDQQELDRLIERLRSASEQMQVALPNGGAANASPAAAGERTTGLEGLIRTAAEGYGERSATSLLSGERTASWPGTLGKTLLNGVTLSPIWRGIGKLFGLGGSNKAEPAPLPRFTMPRRQQLELGLNGDAISGVRFESGGRLTTLAPEQKSPQQVVVQVQALDSQSFLDRSDLVASAVRKALLESHGLADVVNEG
jgi:hypothetical protein